MPEERLRFWLWLLVGAVSLGVVQLLVLPPRPSASLAQATPAGFPGPAWSQAEEGSAYRTRERALSPTLTFKAMDGFFPEAGQAMLLITAAAARRPVTYQVAALTAGRPGLEMRDRRILRTPRGELARGSIGGAPALQTCLLPRGRTAVRRAELLSGNARPAPRGFERAASLLGFRAKPPYRCLLVTLVATDPATGTDRLRHLWDRLPLPALSADSQAEQAP